MDYMEVVWSEAKRRANLSKHRVDFRDAAYVFEDPNRLWGHDRDHSDDEDRWWSIGMAREKILFVVAVERERDRVRLITARKASTDERLRYYESCTD